MTTAGNWLGYSENQLHLTGSIWQNPASSKLWKYANTFKIYTSATTGQLEFSVLSVLPWTTSPLQILRPVHGTMVNEFGTIMEEMNVKNRTIADFRVV